MLAGCGGDEPEPDDDLTVRDALPRIVDAETPDGHYSLPLDGSATLELPTDTPPPEVTGTSVQLIDVASLQDPGALLWELRATEVGTTTIVADVDGTERTWVIDVPIDPDV
jgi:hypothetical protein